MRTLNFSVFILCGLIPFFASSQTYLEGRLVDVESGKPVDFANIGVLTKNIGTVSDFDGSFKIEANSKAVKSYDSIQISRIGYETLKFSIEDFSEQLNESPIILLQAAAYELDGVVVKKSDADNRRIGYESSSRRLFGYWNDSLALGGEHASKIMVRKGPLKLEDVSFNVAANISDSILVRVNIYDLHKGLPGKNRTKANILHTIKQRQGTITIDLSPYNIVVRNHFVISLELLKIYGGRVGIGISAFDDGARSYTRVVSQGKWKRMRKGVTIAYHLNTSEVEETELKSNKTAIAERKKPTVVSLLWDQSRSMKGRNVAKELDFLDAYFQRLGDVTVELQQFSNEWFPKKIFQIRKGNWDELKTELLASSYDGGPSQKLWETMVIGPHTLLFTDGKYFPDDLGIDWTGELFIINGQHNANHKYLKTLAEDHGGNYLNLEKLGDAAQAVTYTQYSIKDNLDYTTRQDVKKASLVKGSVGDLEEPLQNVLVQVRNSNRQSRTDADGNFVIQAFDGEILEFSYPGRENAFSVVNTGSRMLKVIMPIGITALEEVVVSEDKMSKELEKPLKKNISTRFGTLDMEKMGFSVKQMEGSAISRSAQTLMDALEGKFPGVDVVRKYPEDYEMVLLRGRALAWDIDGHVYPPTSPPNHIDLHDIKDITIMPLGWSTAKYGRLAPGGVILVRTISNTFDEEIKPSNVQPSNQYQDDAIELATGISSKPAYVQRIVAANSLENAYDTYIVEQKKYGSIPSFYREASVGFLEYWKNLQLANRVQSNLMEVFPENEDALKILAYAYESEGNHVEAKLVYEHIHQLNPSPQAIRDLARVNVVLDQPKEAWQRYKSYINNRETLNDKGLDIIVKREILELVKTHGEIIGVDRTKFPSEVLGDLSLIVEWNDPNTQFELQFVGPNQRFFNWNNTTGLSKKEAEAGNLSEIFDIENAAQGDWLINMTYMGNQANLPTYLKFTLKNNQTGKEEIKLITLRQRNVKYKVMNITANGMLFY